MNYEENRKNIVMTTSDGYEIKIGDTVFVASHEYGTADLLDIAIDYLAEKNVRGAEKTA